MELVIDLGLSIIDYVLTFGLDNVDESLNAGDATDRSQMDSTMASIDPGPSVPETQPDQPPQVKEKPKKKVAVKVPDMDPSHFYDYESMIFKPVITDESNLSENLLSLL